MKQTAMTLKRNRQLTADVCELIFEGDTSGITRCGQFVNIDVPGYFLRRPISVCDYDEGNLTLIVKKVGAGTKALCEAERGDCFNMLTGLGNGYDITKATGEKCVLAGGGVGVPPLYALAKELIKNGRTPVCAMGFNTKDDVFYEKEFRALGCEVRVSTADGSYGEKGFVTKLIEDSGCDYVFCCGPEAMLKAVHGLEQIKDGQFSFEERMGCGFGACVGCTCETKYGLKRICRDGPVLFKEEIVW